MNHSPLEASNYRALLRFVPDQDVSLDSFYFGGAHANAAGNFFSFRRSP